MRADQAQRRADRGGLRSDRGASAGSHDEGQPLASAPRHPARRRANGRVDRAAASADARHDSPIQGRRAGRPAATAWAERRARWLGVAKRDTGERRRPRRRGARADSPLRARAEPGRVDSLPRRRPADAVGTPTPSWPRERPATTVACDRRVHPPGHKQNSSDPPGRYEQRRGANAVRVTVEQAAILQGFPAGYPWQGARTRQFTQLGNAVPPPLAHRVAEQAIAPTLESAAEYDVRNHPTQEARPNESPRSAARRPTSKS